MIVNVCPAGVARAEPDRVWKLLTTPESFEAWQGARFVSARPPGPAATGQRVELAAPALGRRWPVVIDVGGVDPNRRWIDLTVRLPFGIVNHEHVTLAETPEGATLVRLN